MGFEFAGLNEYRDAFLRLRSRGREKAGEGVKEHMDMVLKPLVDELVPKLTGALVETGRVVPGPTDLSYTLRYGNSAVQNRSMVDYAAAVHEIEYARHASPTSAKFLSKPLEETKGKIGDKVGAKLDQLIQEG